MKNVGLVLEGGAMRGMYTAGVLDVLMDNNINIDGIIGVSAGALFGPNYYSKQKGRVIRYSKRFSKDLRYISALSLLLTGNVVNKRFAFYKMNEILDKFDEETFDGGLQWTTCMQPGRSYRRQSCLRDRTGCSLYCGPRGGG